MDSVEQAFELADKARLTQPEIAQRAGRTVTYVRLLKTGYRPKRGNGLDSVTKAIAQLAQERLDDIQSAIVA